MEIRVYCCSTVNFDELNNLGSPFVAASLKKRTSPGRVNKASRIAYMFDKMLEFEVFCLCFAVR
jgi:hypothetical protein